jgi:hypothetical protein
MELSDDAKRVRALLSKEGTADIRLELHRISTTEFAVVEDGRNIGVFYRGLAPPRPGAPGLAYRGSYLDISDAFEACIAKRYPDRTARNIQTSSDRE